MTNGVFQLTPAPVMLTKSVLITLRRCRTYLSDDVKFTYCLPSAHIAVSIDMLRLSQVLSNALRCA